MDLSILEENVVLSVLVGIFFICLILAIALTITKSIWRWIFDIDYQVELLREIRDILKERQGKDTDVKEK